MADQGRRRDLSFTVVSKATQDRADRVNESLPVHISPEDVEKNALFVKLLTTLSQHIKEDGVSKMVHKDLTEATDRLRHEKTRWLHQDMLHQELHALLLDYQMNLSEGTRGDATNQFYKAVDDCLMVAEIRDYLECSVDPGVNVTLLGLKKDNLTRRNPHKKHLPAIQQKLIPEIENRLRQKCETLVKFHDCSASAALESSKLSFARASQLPVVLQGEQQALVEEQRQLKRDRISREKQFWQYYQALMSSLGVLEKIIIDHCLQSQKECDTVTSEWLVARCDAMCLKIKLLELQLMCDTYYGETVQALTIIRHEVDSAIDTTKHELSEASQACKSYESVGLGFETLVKEYTHLRDEIANKQWAIRELKPVLDLDIPTA